MLNEKIVSDIAEKVGMPEVLELFRSSETPADGVNPLAEKLGTLTVLPTATFEERIGNERRLSAEEATRTAVGNTYGALDKRILAETGIARKEGERTDDYALRAAKEKYGKPVNESEEMQRIRLELQEAKDAVGTLNTTLEQLKVTHANEQKTTQINNRLDAAINSLPIDVPADRLDSQRQFVKYMLNQRYTIDLVEGKEQFTDKETGKVAKNAGLTPLSAAEVVAQFAPSVVSLKTSQKRGAGVEGHSQHNNTDTEDFSAYPNIEAYKAALVASGITLMSKDGQDKIEKYLKYQADKK